MAEGDGAAQVFKEIKISFDDFAESFNDYASKLNETEGVWREKMNIWKSMAGGLGQMESSMSKLQKSTKGWASELETVTKNLTSIGGQWSNLQKLMRSGSSALYRGGKALTNGEDVSALSSIAGTAAKAFGIAGKAVAELAVAATAAAAGIYLLAKEGAGRGRRAAGFGADVGSMTAAEIYMQRWVNPDAAMANAAQGRYDITSPQYVAMRAGLGMKGSFEGRETGALSEEMVRKTASIMRQGSDRTALSIAHARGLGSLFSDEELIRLRNSNEKQIQEYIKEASERKSQYELTKEEIDAENKLITSMDSLEATFITEMERWTATMIPKLTEVVTSIENLIKSIDGWKDWFISWMPGKNTTPLDTESPVPPEGHQKWMHPGEMWDDLKKLFSNLSPIGSAQAGELPQGTAGNPLVVQDKTLIDLLNQQKLDAASDISTASLLGGGAGFGGTHVPLGIRMRGSGGTFGANVTGGGSPGTGGMTFAASMNMAPEDRALLDILALHESGQKSYLSGDPDRGAAFQGNRYQFLGATWASNARELGLDPKNLSPENQDKIALHLAKKLIGNRWDEAQKNPSILRGILGPTWHGVWTEETGATFRKALEGERLRRGPTTTDPSKPDVRTIVSPNKTSMNDLSNYQGAHPAHFVRLNVNNQAGANLIVQGGMLGAGSGQFPVA
jgi:hypothetical protein